MAPPWPLARVEGDFWVLLLRSPFQLREFRTNSANSVELIFEQTPHILDPSSRNMIHHKLHFADPSHTSAFPGATEASFERPLTHFRASWAAWSPPWASLASLGLPLSLPGLWALLCKQTLDQPQSGCYVVILRPLLEPCLDNMWSDIKVTCAI